MAHIFSHFLVHKHTLAVLFNRVASPSGLFSWSQLKKPSPHVSSEPLKSILGASGGLA